jgi:Lipocalin-like domain
VNRRSILNLSAITALGLVVSLNSAVAQTKSIKDQLVGTWTLVSETDTQSDGKKIEGFGPNPLGVYMFDANGHFAQMLLRADLPKYSNRLQGTPEQYKAVGQGLVAYYGTYSVNEADKVVNVHILGGSFATFNGTDGKRIIASLTADELKFTNPATSGGTTADSVWKRAK